MSATTGNQVRVLFFASLREATGTDELSLEITGPVSLEELLQRLEEHLTEAAMSALRSENVRLALNQTLLTGPVTISPGDEVAFLPPVTGG